jgi:hypothetical protein
LGNALSFLTKPKETTTMLVTIHTVKEVADMLHKSGYDEWPKDYEACLALAQYLEDLSEETKTPIQVDMVDLAVRFEIFKNVAAFNKEYGTTLENLDIAYSLTTIIPLSRGRFIAQKF